MISCRTIDYATSKKECFLTHKTCDEPGVNCYANNIYVSCELSTPCAIPPLQFATASQLSAIARDNVTVVCNDGNQFLDGNLQSVHHCQADGTWNATIKDCIPNILFDFLCIP